MSNIDKRALRESAEKATPGPWEMEQENIWFTDAEGYTKHLIYVQQGDDVDDKQDHYNTAFIAEANPATMLAMLDELESDKEQIKTLESRNRRLEGVIDAAEKRIAELRDWNAGLAQESFTYQQRVAELQSVNDELTKFPDQIVSYVARMGTSEIGSHAKNVIYRAAQKVKDRAAGIGKGE